jgi:hypothetical protein
MERRRIQVSASRSIALFVLLAAVLQAKVQDTKTPYPNMAPIDQYLMADRNAEIAMARSAAPEAVSRDAKILVLGRRGYETAVEGKNGFVCVVERSWMSPFDHPMFWNPRLRGPICFNPPGGAIHPADHFPEDGVDIVRVKQSPDHRENQSGVRKEGTACAGSGRDVLHDVETRISRRLSRALGSALDVLRPTNGWRNLGFRCARFPGLSESTISGRSGAGDGLHGPSGQVVGRNGGASDVEGLSGCRFRRSVF